MHSKKPIASMVSSAAIAISSSFIIIFWKGRYLSFYEFFTCKNAFSFFMNVSKELCLEIQREMTMSHSYRKN